MTTEDIGKQIEKQAADEIQGTKFERESNILIEDFLEAFDAWMKTRLWWDKEDLDFVTKVKELKEKRYGYLAQR